MVPFLLSAWIAAQSSGQPSIMLLGIQWKGDNADAAAAGLLNDQVLARLQASGQFSSVTSPQDINAVVDLERQRQMLDCTDSGCLAEVASAMGVTYVASGTLGQVGDNLSITLKVFSAKNAAVAATSSRLLPMAQKGELGPTLVSMTEELLQRMFGVPHPPQAVQPRAEEQPFLTRIQVWRPAAVAALASLVVAVSVITAGHFLFALSVPVIAAGSAAGALIGFVSLVLFPAALLSALAYAALAVNALSTVAVSGRGHFKVADRALWAMWLAASAIGVALGGLVSVVSVVTFFGATTKVGTVPNDPDGLGMARNPAGIVAITALLSLALGTWWGLLGLGGLSLGAASASIGEGRP